MKKQHDATSLANELEGSSVFFQERPPARAEAVPRHSNGTRPVGDHREGQPATPVDRPSDRATGQPAGRSVPKRPTQRRAFEFYRDQLETFKAWSAVDIAEGGEGNMSDWAREAFDDYIAKRKGQGKASDRSAERSTDRRPG